LPGDELHQDVFGDESQFHEGGTDPLPGLVLFFEGAIELLLGDQAFLDEEFPDFPISHGIKPFRKRSRGGLFGNPSGAHTLPLIPIPL